MVFKTGQRVICRIDGIRELCTICDKMSDGYKVQDKYGKFWVFPEESIFIEPGTPVLVDSIQSNNEYANCQDHNVVIEDIRHQSHYEQFKIQSVVFIAENNLDFLTGNIIKYVLRHNKKDGLKDLEKAKHCLDMLIQKASGQEVKP